MRNAIKTICTLGLISALGVSAVSASAFAAGTSPSNNPVKKQEVGKVKPIAKGKVTTHNKASNSRYHKKGTHTSQKPQKSTLPTSPSSTSTAPKK